MGTNTVKVETADGRVYEHVDSDFQLDDGVLLIIKRGELRTSAMYAPGVWRTVRTKT